MERSRIAAPRKEDVAPQVRCRRASAARTASAGKRTAPPLQWEPGGRRPPQTAPFLGRHIRQARGSEVGQSDGRSGNVEPSRQKEAPREAVKTGSDPMSAGVADRFNGPTDHLKEGGDRFRNAATDSKRRATAFRWDDRRLGGGDGF